MNRLRTSVPGVSAGVLCVCAGLPCAALGVDKSWNSTSATWSEGARWFPMGVPGAADHVRLGNMESVQNSTVSMTAPADCAALDITDGMTLRTGHSSLEVGGDVLVSGVNTVAGPGGQFLQVPSRLVLGSVDGNSLIADGASISGGGVVVLEGAFARFGGLLAVGDACEIRGLGVLDFTGAGTTFTNRGTVRPGAGAGGIAMRQLGNGVFDLDGSSGAGVIDLASEGATGSNLRVVGSSLSDDFDGVVRLASSSVLEMELGSGWRGTASSRVEMTGAGGVPNQAVIRGGPMSFAGEVEIAGDGATLAIEPESLVLEPAASFMIGVGAAAHVGTSGGAPTEVGGGSYAVAEDGVLRFRGPVLLRGGDFSTPSPAWTDGYVIFEEPVTMSGTMSFGGVVIMQGGVTVAAATTIQADTFDMDGPVLFDEDGPIPAAAWSIGQALTINAGAMSTGSNTVRTPITIGGGAAARLTVVLDDPAEEWRSTGSISLAGIAGAPHLLATRMTGTPLAVAGALSVPSGRVAIGSPVRFEDGSVVTIGSASAELRMTNTARIGAGASVEGAGTLVVGPSGIMTLEQGVATGSVGITNLGTLRIADGPGLVAVDRLQTSGTLAVEIGGYVAGAEHDQLVVTGATAVLGGELDVGVISCFRPMVGDAFTVITTVAGVSGALAPTAQSRDEGWTFNWQVSAVGGDVVVTVTSVVPPGCAADFDGNGIVGSQDFFAFLGELFMESARADVNHDGIINSQDLFDFLTLFFGGCK